MSKLALDNIHHICYGVYMNRYQVYLDPQVVESTDDLARSLDISRSQIIRDVVSRVIREYKKILSMRNYVSSARNPILEMIGMGKTSQKHISENVDEIYFPGERTYIKRQKNIEKGIIEISTKLKGELESMSV